MIRKITTVEDLKITYPIMKELRTYLSKDLFFQLYKTLSKESNYILVGIFENNHLAGFVGYRYTSDFIRGKHLYIDDLIIKKSLRSKGLGTKLLNFLVDESRKRGVHTIRLNTHKDNTRAINFYKDQGFENTSLSFELNIDKYLNS